MGVGLINRTKAVPRGSRLDTLRDLVLLGGSVRAGNFATQIGRPLFELPVASELRILDLWHRQATALSESFDLPGLTVRVMVDRAAKVSARQAVSTSALPLNIEPDPFEYRGTGGVLRDAAAAYEDDEHLLVINAAQVPLQPLGQLTEALAATGGDVCLVSHDDGTPSGLFLVRCGTLRHLPAAGFVDMKEQALPTIAQRDRVTILARSEPTALPIRTLADYCAALRRYHQQLFGGAASLNPFAENWEPVFSIVEHGAVVDPSARLHDSVVLDGGRVGANAVLVRSVVCAGGVVAPGQVVVDQTVVPAEERVRRR